jgi:2-C-methyl-D-erythritol 4-phosphate cytidylyltransferase
MQQSLSVIITAGGIGSRMQSSLPKQFLQVLGEPILLFTLRRFYTILPEAQFIITLPTDWHSTWNDYLLEHNCSIPHLVLDGGQERFHSVSNALQKATGQVVLVHDGVRPFFSQEMITEALNLLGEKRGVVPVIDLTDSLREVLPEAQSRPVDRKRFKAVQTPQIFRKEELMMAYNQEFQSDFTDDASVFEAWGGTILMVNGSNDNLKITHPRDLVLAQEMAKSL